MFKKLFTPFSIGECEIPNRLVVPAMVTNYCTEDGEATEQYIAYHEEKAKGGWGLIITEDYPVNEHAMGYSNVAGLWKDEQIAGHKELTERIHKYSSKIFCQIYHAGRQSAPSVNGGVTPVAPSAIACPWLQSVPKELTKDEIKEIITQFGSSALRVKKAGFDGIEIHAGHGYLIAEFLSTYANKRSDEYGGCFDNRARFLKEILSEVRMNVGADFPILVRFSADECVPGGRDISESRVLATLLEEWGADALHVSSGVYGDHNKGIVSPMYVNHAWTVDFANEIKQLVDIPVITANRINDPRMADSILVMNKADFIAMGRGSLADPYLPSKAQSGDLTSIRYCIGCLQGCVMKLTAGEAVTCLVNPSLGQEYRIDYSKTDAPKNMIVIGGGPAGLEAARVLAMRGHKIQLFEKNNFLGGQFKSAAFPPAKGELSTYIAWLISELEKYDVSVNLNSEITKEDIDSLQPDVVVVATGGAPVRPPIKGIEGDNVYFAEDVLLGNVSIGNNVIIAGGGEVGSETAAHLALQSKKISIVEMRDDILLDLDGVNAFNLTLILDEYKVNRYTGSKIVEIMEDGVVLENETGTQKVNGDSVVLALGYAPKNNLVSELAGSAYEVQVIGGATKTSNALVASREGFELALNY